MKIVFSETPGYRHGPFDFKSSFPSVSNGSPGRSWTMFYGDQQVSQRHIAGLEITRGTLMDAFSDALTAFVKKAKHTHSPTRVDLMDVKAGSSIADFACYDTTQLGLEPLELVVPDTKWQLRCTRTGRVRNVHDIREYMEIVANHVPSEQEARNGWIAGMLPRSVLTHDQWEWRAPTSWEIRHVASQGALVDYINMSGPKAAELVGVTAQNFRKYTAHEGAESHQKISFAMWHLLLHRLGVQRAPQGLRTPKPSHPEAAQTD
ncbi:hypothetical protein [Delftia sp. ASV31]|uniref:hypothetical protein n=1 Tax=Delftia sp. ASV31 TaxID=2795113 RepID=UPI0018EC9B58|nr:hypothetical protein [Delftia sp. ASV31]